MWKFILAASGFCLMLACQPAPSGHSHGPGGDHVHAEEETFSYTRWTDKVELFVEFKPLVVGEVSRFAAHFTTVEDHKPIAEAKVTVSLIVGEKGIKQTVEAPSSPGIFTPGLKPTVHGTGKLIFELETPLFTERIEFDEVKVYPDGEIATAELEQIDDGGDAIDFLKEQAWKIDFLVERATIEKLEETIRTTGEILPMQGFEQEVTAPSSGVVVFANTKLLPGKPVSKGRHLFTLVATGDPDENLDAKFSEAKANLKKAEAEYQRRKELLESQAIAQKDFETSELAYELAKVELENIAKYIENGGRKVFVPRSGFVKEVLVDPGAFVETGTSIMTITQNKNLQLAANLPQQYFSKIRQINSADFRTSYSRELLSIQDFNGKLLSFGQSVSDDEPFIPLYFELDNNGSLLPGSLVELWLHLAGGKSSLVVPRSAIIEEYGGYYVIVQLSGEQFEKRAVKVGVDNGRKVQIVEGLKEGEMVVSKGAYQVKMASMASSIPAHGHTH
ncbi:MAG: efflux RND transporter periplasmic adaptor subunit [Bacteroidetes bacterium]|nr:MAG: efflux RND transporter periplasmic adaptor subunit [Bacteroidota bacterium]